MYDSNPDYAVEGDRTTLTLANFLGSRSARMLRGSHDGRHGPTRSERRPLCDVSSDVDYQVGLGGGIGAHSPAFAHLGDHRVGHSLTCDEVDARRVGSACLARVDGNETATARVGHRHVQYDGRSIGGDATTADDQQFGD